MAKRKLKLNKVRILKRVLFAMLPGLIVAGVWGFANPTQKTSITAPVENGLVGYWKLDENPAIHQTEIRDSSPFGNHGTLSTNNGEENKSVEGKISRALSFDGVDDYVEVGTGISFGDLTVWTIEAWLYPTGFPGGYAALWGNYSSGGYVMIWENAVGFERYYPSWWGNVNVGALENCWSHIVLTMDASRQFKVYRDGVYKGANTSGESTAIEMKYLGRRQWQTASWYQGLIDEVRIYNRGFVG